MKKLDKRLEEKALKKYVKKGRKNDKVKRCDDHQTQIRKKTKKGLLSPAKVH